MNLFISIINYLPYNPYTMWLNAIHLPFNDKTVVYSLIQNNLRGLLWWILNAEIVIRWASSSFLGGLLNQNGPIHRRKQKTVLGHRLQIKFTSITQLHLEASNCPAEFNNILLDSTNSVRTRTTSASCSKTLQSPCTCV